MSPTQSKLATYELPLRVLTLLTTVISLPLLIATTIVSLNYHVWWRYRPVTAFCFGYIPLALTAFASARTLIHHRRYGRMPQASFKLVDGVAFIAYVSILTAIWAVEIGNLERPGFGLLAGYTTAPMIVNMLIHGYIFALNARSVASLFMAAQVHKCPNCHSSFTARAPQVEERKQSGEGYSLLRGEDYLDVDADAVHYTDGSSGPSDAQMLHPDNESKGESKSESKEEGKKVIIDV
ncbi:hypothetical protein COCCADRAFT_106142 [Bipolaris zeicola 26-R-13]|uniref:Uncharacterized protein n=1 Tax=Cochliobolus carbonum (strain 26-R-13) TaxID=930089 RepID=W6XQ96_COCC2|nr:uncharacterized protein COCCADRAFT_106142 [Bipolaris zeicola 26-R-13]EUC29577.1 hypothetical protein COCCADRAFT_106142 [Bipolaris zeicola 26-R-13]